MFRIKNRLIIYLLGAALLAPSFNVQAQTPYQKPPKVVLDVLDAPDSAVVSVSPARDKMLLATPVRYPTIAELAEPMLRLAGSRINPKTNGPHNSRRIIKLTLKNIADGKETALALPPNANLGMPEWSNDGKQFAVTNTTSNSAGGGIELWIGDAATGKLRHIPGVRLNAAFSSGGFGGGRGGGGGGGNDTVQWLPDGKTLLCRTIVAGRGAPPAAPAVPTGPNVQENYGKATPAPTFQDLLRNPYDEKLYEYYATTQLALINSATGRVTPFGKPAIFGSVEPAPDGNHFLVATIHRPYSYLLTAGSFPRLVEVWDHSGKSVYKLADLPLADQVPIEGVPTGPRNYNWRPTEPATLVWVEALDGGDAKKKVSPRDVVKMLKAPFTGQPVDLVKTEQRFAGMTWGEKDGLVFVRDFDRNRRWSRTFLLNADNTSQQARIIWDRSSQDRYNDPGNPVMKQLPNGQSVIHQNGDQIFLSGQGASPKGDRPFLDRFDLKTLKSERLFQCDDSSYESFVALLAADGSRFITRYETQSTPPNYFIRKAGAGDKQALTNFPDPTPQLRGIKKQLVRYKRKDGVDLSFTLYLPPDYKEGTRLPTVVWAYPIEFSDAGMAGQVSGSANRFTTFGGMSHLFFTLMGYAVLDDATMPVIGDPETMNNTYVEQIVASAEAAIDKAVEMGVTDRSRVGVGGHSYGAFMTANLLAHSDLFKAGIARSGAYNRTLTPFGFQSERRTFWEAPEMYFKVSPFMYANKIKEPILLIHGEADNNSGTHPIQSDRMFQAIKGNGGNVRYVTLPLEAHGYAARESLEHTLWEMITWMDKYVKGVQPTALR
ncbi:MAG TPA: prolyl oligopeptidase family serine peptidase [Blastocatellia bacterium]|nr:prolyl oligopeptidase family serine peptidase [Blastocatellia bacterium]